MTRLQELERSELGGRVLRAHWKWAENHLMLWLLFSLTVFGGAWFLFDYMGADDRSRTPALILLATLLIINAIWRATGALAARLEMTFILRRGEPTPTTGIKDYPTE